MALHSTIFGIDSYLRTTTICELTVADGELKALLPYTHLGLF